MRQRSGFPSCMVLRLQTSAVRGFVSGGSAIANLRCYSLARVRAGKLQTPAAGMPNLRCGLLKSGRTGGSEHKHSPLTLFAASMAFTAAQIAKQTKLFTDQLDDVMDRWKAATLPRGAKFYLAAAGGATHVSSQLGTALGWIAQRRDAIMQPWRLEVLTGDGVIYLMSSNEKDKLFEVVKDDEYTSMYE
jgi:hypothetical protein